MEVAKAPYQRQQTSLPSSTRSNEEEGRDLVRGGLSVEKVVDQDRCDESDEQGDDDGGN